MKHSAFTRSLFLLPALLMLAMCSSGTSRSSGENTGKGSQDSVEMSEDSLAEVSIDSLMTPDGVVRKSKLDSVVWYDTDGYFSAHLYISELDTTVYKGFSDEVHSKMTAHINSKETLECLERAKRVFLEELSALPMEEKEPLIRKSHALLTIFLERHGYVKRVNIAFFKQSIKHPSDEFIRRVDRKIRAIKFPPTTDYGINFNRIVQPFRNSLLLPCLE